MSDEAISRAIEELTDLLLGMECAIEVEKMVLAGMEPHGREWEALRPGVGQAPPLLVRLIRERASSLSNVRRQERSAEALRMAIAALATKRD